MIYLYPLKTSEDLLSFSDVFRGYNEQHRAVMVNTKVTVPHNEIGPQITVLRTGGI